MRCMQSGAVETVVEVEYGWAVTEVPLLLHSPSPFYAAET